MRTLTALALAAILATSARAQQVLLTSHDRHLAAEPFEGTSCTSCNFGPGRCAADQCAKCQACDECVRITDTKKTQVPVYSCKVKATCIPSCDLFGHLFGDSNGCQKIEVRQLVKKYRTDEVCVTRCVTPEEATKIYEAKAKKATTPNQSPAPAPPPTKLPTGAVMNDLLPPMPVSLGAPVEPGATPYFIVGKQ